MEKVKVTGTLTVSDLQMMLKKFGGTEPVYIQLGSEHPGAPVFSADFAGEQDGKLFLHTVGEDLGQKGDLATQPDTLNVGALNGHIKQHGGGVGVYVRFQNPDGKDRVAGIAQGMGGQDASSSGKLILRTRDADEDGLVVRNRDVHRMGSGITEEVAAGEHKSGGKTSDGKAEV